MKLARELVQKRELTVEDVVPQNLGKQVSHVLEVSTGFIPLIGNLAKTMMLSVCSKPIYISSPVRSDSEILFSNHNAEETLEDWSPKITLEFLLLSGQIESAFEMLVHLKDWSNVRVNEWIELIW